MKAKLFILFLFVIAVVSCNKDDDDNQTNISGNYIGIFERNGNTSNVELSFNSGAFNGQSEVKKYPALCNGTYSISGNKITFENACPWTAEFDWTLILGGEWSFNMNNNLLIMTKSNGDKYTLTKQ